MLYDVAEIKGTARITRDGYFVADALVARANNIQEYRASELDLADRKPGDVVRVFRPEAEVFAKDALASMAHRPITLDHPSGPVTSDNWRKLGVGDIGGDIMRDGDFIRVPIKIMDAAAIDSVTTDRRGFSLGYAIKLDMTPGEHEGHAYDAVAREFRYNHLAACRAPRGGPELRIVDERPNPSGDPKMPHVLIIDGLQVPNVSDEAKAAIEKLQGQIGAITTAKDAAETSVATLTTDKATLDAKVVTLEKQLVDAKLTPAQLRDAAKAYQAVVDKATALGVTVADDADEASVMKAVVDAKLGDAAKDWNETQIAASFATLTKDAKVEQRDPIRTPVIANDSKVVEDAYSEMIKDMQDASKPKQAQAA